MKYYGIIAAFQRGKGPRENAKRKPKERNTKMTITEAELASLTYGCELEYEGISQERAAKVVAEVTGGTAYYEGCHLHNWVVKMPDGRKWNIVSDGSLWGTSAEVVTPILRYGDMDTLQKVVRAMRKARAKVNSRTGLHVHVGAQGMTPTQIKNLVKIFYKQETLILKATGTQEARISSYTRRTDHAFVDKICAMHSPTMAKLADAYYGGCRDRNCHYSSARYRALNLHNLWNGTKGTVEFRYHEQSLHAGVIKAAVLIDLLMVLKAKSAKAASAKNPRPYSEASAKYDFRVFLLRLGANGETFKSMRKHLCKNLPGSAAWKDGRHD